ncbi:urease accessory protein UreJ [Rhodoferax lacus]|uniref:Urease accessory protein UreJ n=1 Tax=Rhodoferax lacus TaxID=2184758 RepID=A0A3E1R6I4_9BURK|nr:HupE/UreJ family protein [Rhodoferax lacus]RFO94917.1 urease accessory protein UreJ [Rhodoferax lacus]
MTYLFNTSWAKRSALACLALTCGMAQAHTGHGVHTVMEGLSHPLGLDHLLAMVAVGVWSVRALPAGKTWQGPATFLLALLLSAVLGASGVSLPYLEHAIALSVVLFGAMLVAANSRLPAGAGLGLVALAASLHGLAHGAELPASGLAGFGAYAAGFVLTTTLLHGGGVLFGLSMQRFMAQRAKVATAATGLVLGGAGLYLLQQL